MENFTAIYLYLLEENKKVDLGAGSISFTENYEDTTIKSDTIKTISDITNKIDELNLLYKETSEIVLSKINMEDGKLYGLILVNDLNNPGFSDMEAFGFTTDLLYPS